MYSIYTMYPGDLRAKQEEGQPITGDDLRSLHDIYGDGCQLATSEVATRLYASYGVRVLFGTRHRAPCAAWRAERAGAADDRGGRWAIRVHVFEDGSAAATGGVAAGGGAQPHGRYLGFVHLRSEPVSISARAEARAGGGLLRHVTTAFMTPPRYMLRPRYHLVDGLLGPAEGVRAFRGVPFCVPLGAALPYGCLLAAVHEAALLGMHRFRLRPLTSSDVTVILLDDIIPEIEACTVLAAGHPGMDQVICRQLGAVPVGHGAVRAAVRQAAAGPQGSLLAAAQAAVSGDQAMGLADALRQCAAADAAVRVRVRRASRKLLQRGATLAEAAAVLRDRRVGGGAVIETIRADSYGGGPQRQMAAGALEAHRCITDYLANGLPVMLPVDHGQGHGRYGHSRPHCVFVFGMHLLHDASDTPGRELRGLLGAAERVDVAELPGRLVYHDLRRPFEEAPASRLIHQSWRRRSDYPVRRSALAAMLSPGVLPLASRVPARGRPDCRRRGRSRLDAPERDTRQLGPPDYLQYVALAPPGTAIGIGQVRRQVAWQMDACGDDFWRRYATACGLEPGGLAGGQRAIEQWRVVVRLLTSVQLDCRCQLRSWASTTWRSLGKLLDAPDGSAFYWLAEVMPAYRPTSVERAVAAEDDLQQPALVLVWRHCDEAGWPPWAMVKLAAAGAPCSYELLIRHEAELRPTGVRYAYQPGRA